MNWRESILSDYPLDLQRQHRAKVALKALEDAVSELASLGHPLHVEPGFVPLPAPEWPRNVFHVKAGLRVVACQAELDELGPDWYPTLEEAKYQAGLTKQMQRGGIFDKALPSLERLTDDQRLQAQKRAEELIKFEKDRVHALAVEARTRNRGRSNGRATVDMPGTHPDSVK